MILVFGSFNADYIWRSQQLPAPGETLLGEFSSAPGGKGFNQALAAHRLGAETLFIGGLGRDGGAAMARSVAAEDALPCHFFDCEQATGSACVVVDRQGRNQIVVAPGANLAVTGALLEQLDASFARATVVLVQLETAPESTLHALQAGRRRGALTLLNPAPAPETLDPELLAACELLTPNESEFVSLLALLGGPQIGMDFVELPDDQLHALCRRLKVPTVVITLGARGAFVSHGHDWRGDTAACYRVASEAVNVVDSTGAGDCFNGALAAGMLLWPDRPFAEQIRWAGAAAGLSTEHPGGAPAMPSISALRQRFPGRFDR